MSMLPQVLAHQSGDGITIVHCPFCGSGQVLGRSDGNTECQFCNQAFMVRVQPMFSAFPQSINGMPVDIPGMPPGMPPPGDPMTAGAPPGADGEDGGGAPPFGQDGGADSADGPPGSDDSGNDSGDGPPFGKKESAFRTTAGHQLPRTAYVDYLMRQLEGDR
ncbi:hypothetical protein OG497_37655 [Streptomyces sp. NBC_01242]|uniref:hypothetical protein n=1 Tax=Streptomyces sp. NBC_01242 TaxID=2903795 RepID=UPI00225638C9|nr:hypothetical protein [Streptomyces sp. NBC_01242]MCX4799584.1 hypothetical protein [Streptomyces sp. NBC_01242]